MEMKSILMFKVVICVQRCCHRRDKRVVPMAVSRGILESISMRMGSGRELKRSASSLLLLSLDVIAHRIFNGFRRGMGMEGLVFEPGRLH